MLMLPPSVRIYLCTVPADMRRSFDGLAAMTEEILQRNPLSGHLFVFRNRRGDRVKGVVLGCAMNVSENLRCCAEDEGQALRIPLAGEDSKPPEAAAFKRRGGERSGKVALKGGRWVLGR